MGSLHALLLHRCSPSAPVRPRRLNKYEREDLFLPRVRVREEVAGTTRWEFTEGAVLYQHFFFHFDLDHIHLNTHNNIYYNIPINHSLRPFNPLPTPEFT